MVGNRHVRFAVTGAFSFALAAFGNQAQAQTVPLDLQSVGECRATAISMGSGASRRQLSARSDGFFTLEYPVQHTEPRVYSLVVEYSTETYALPLRLHRNSRPIEMRVQFDGPGYCHERFVREAEQRAQETNIVQALRKYLLATHLYEIEGEGACRGIQLATVPGSPFMPPVSDYATWERVLGARQAAIYRRQVERSEATLLNAARSEWQGERNFAVAAEINAYMLERVSSNEEARELYLEEGGTQRQLQNDQAYLDTLSGLDAAASESTAVEGELMEGALIEVDPGHAEAAAFEIDESQMSAMEAAAAEMQALEAVVGP